MKMDEPRFPVSVRQIIEWVRAQDPRMLIGQCKDPDTCLIATYLAETNPEWEFEVQPYDTGESCEVYYLRAIDCDWEQMSVGKQKRVRIANLNPTFNELALAFDEMAGDERLTEGGEAAMVTAGEFLAKWEGA